MNIRKYNIASLNLYIGQKLKVSFMKVTGHYSISCFNLKNINTGLSNSLRPLKSQPLFSDMIRYLHILNP